jgi:transposase
MRDFRHETVFKGSESEGTGRRRSWHAERKEVARVFGVSEPTIRRYLRLRRETGDVEPKPVPGPPARKREALRRERLPAQVRLNPDLTLAEHCELSLRRKAA